MPRLDATALQLEARHLHTLQGLLRQYVPHAEVWAYGSRVAGQAHEGSDVDVVLRNPADLHQPVHGAYEPQEALQQSLLPQRIDLHDWAKLPSAFHHNIEARYVVLQEPQHPL